MTPALREDAADEAQARITRWDAMRARWQADLSELMDDDKQTLICLGDAMNAIQEAESYLSIASAMEQAGLPDLDSNYPGRRAPGSY